jgi:chromosome segregation ATPase
MVDINELDKRITVLESEFENMEKSIMKIDVAVSENKEATMAIKERLDKWNGSIPHLVEDVQEVKGLQIQLLDKISKNNVADEKREVKMKIVWAAFAALAGAILSYTIKSLVGQ